MAKKDTEKQAKKQAEARNKEALGERQPGKDPKATSPVNPAAPAQHRLAEAEQQGYLGGEPFESRFAEEQRQARIKAGLVPEEG